MRVHERLDDWRRVRRALDDASIGFVPTLGDLHRGHRSLVERSLEDNERTVVSLFLNPTQFDAVADLEAYTVDTRGDLDQLESLGVDEVILPSPAEIYPDDFRYRVVEGELSRRLCGAHREGHFDGVLTVVMKLFNLVRPRRAYFGEKDYQQLELVRGMAAAFFMDLEVVACPTVREADGLALSSRNQRLDADARTRAPQLYRALATAVDEDDARRQLESAGFEVDYVARAWGRRLAAARIGGVRLIDNVPLPGNARG